jgi:hypothetical protein
MDYEYVQVNYKYLVIIYKLNFTILYLQVNLTMFIYSCI